MSMWDLVSGGANDFKDRGFRSWPNPFDGMMQDIEVLACQDTWQARIKMYGTAFGNWFWTNIVPSPVEITRKTLTGGYKCGFYFKTKWGSPIDIIWKDGSVSEMLLEISRPFVEVLFYMWAAESLFSALDTYQSIIYAMAKCGHDHDECLLADGLGEAFAGGASFGTPNAYSTIQDVRHMYSSPGGAIDVFKRGYLKLDAFGRTLAAGSNIFHSNIEFMVGTTPFGGPGAKVEQGALSSGDEATFHLHFEGVVDPCAIRINWDCANDAVGLAHSSLLVTRWTAKWSPEHDPHNCTPWPVHHKDRSGEGHWWIPQK